MWRRAGFSTVVIAAVDTPPCWQVHSRKDYIDVMVYLVWGFIAWNWCIPSVSKALTVIHAASIKPCLRTLADKLGPFFMFLPM